MTKMVRNLGFIYFFLVFIHFLSKLIESLSIPPDYWAHNLIFEYDSHYTKGNILIKLTET